MTSPGVWVRLRALSVGGSLFWGNKDCLPLHLWEEQEVCSGASATFLTARDVVRSREGRWLEESFKMAFWRPMNTGWLTGWLTSWLDWSVVVGSMNGGCEHGFLLSCTQREQQIWWETHHILWKVLWRAFFERVMICAWSLWRPLTAKDMSQLRCFAKR